MTPSAPSQFQMGPPPEVLAVGYTTRTLGPDVTLGTNWSNYNFAGVTQIRDAVRDDVPWQGPLAGQSTQNPDGSVLLGADGSGYGANICSAIAFGGGFYAEAEIEFTPTLQPPGAFNLPYPWFGAVEIDYLAGGACQWAGQDPGYQRWIELYIMQWPRGSLQSIQIAGLIDWYGSPATTLFIPPDSESAVTVPLSDRNTTGCLVVPATDTTQGYIQGFFNGVAGIPEFWNKYDPTAAPPPIRGSTAGSLVDVSHLAMILGTDVTCPMTVYSVSVWQRPVRLP